MKILKVYTDYLKAEIDLHSFGNMNYKETVNSLDMLKHRDGFADIELSNGVEVEFRVINNLEDAHTQIAGKIYSFVEYHADFVSLSEDIRQFIQSRIRDPKDYS